MEEGVCLVLKITLHFVSMLITLMNGKVTGEVG